MANKEMKKNDETSYDVSVYLKLYSYERYTVRAYMTFALMASATFCLPTNPHRGGRPRGNAFD